MKIFFDNIIFSLQRMGGVSVVWSELISRFLRSSKHDISCLEYPDASNNIHRKELSINPINIKIIKKTLFTIQRYLSPSITYKNNFIFHSSYFRICKNKNAINVTTVHDFTYEYFYNHKRKGWFLHVWQRNYAIRHSAAVVCISENTKKDLLKFVKGVDESKLFVINNGVADDYFQIPDSEKIMELSDCLLFVGGRTLYKNCYKFIDFIKDTSYKTVFCGAPLSEFEVNLFNTKLGKERYIVYSNLSNFELNKIYNSCLCLVYPSSYEGFGIPVLEAQKAGCPVVALNASSIPEIFGTDKTLLMQEFTKKTLLDKLSILKNEEKRNEIITNGLENIKRYSWDKIYEEYNNLYYMLMDNT